MNGKKRILVIDDDANFLHEMQGLLMEGCYDVLTCADPTQALLLIRDFSPERIVLDLAMPTWNGRELLDVIRKRYADIPIVICTGVPNVDALSLRRAGASQVFQKPFSSLEFFSALDRAA